VLEVLTRDEVLSHVGGTRALARALDDGSWQRVLRGTYAPGGATLDLSTRAQAAARLLPRRALVADRCLLWLLGIDVLPPGPPVLEVVVPRDVVPPRRADLRARACLLPPYDRHSLVASGVPCLRPVRAVGDLLRLLPLAEAVVVADAVQNAGLADRAALERELEAHAALRGVRSAHRALDLSDCRAESPPETRVRLHLVLAGLRPVPQYDVADASGRWLARVDLAFPEARLAIEYDGRAVHERPGVFARDRQRQNALLSAGWVVLRYTAEDLLSPAALTAEVAALLRRRAA
jgi:very-short-patch-repair endonuclease